MWSWDIFNSPWTFLPLIMVYFLTLNQLGWNSAMSIYFYMLRIVLSSRREISFLPPPLLLSLPETEPCSLFLCLSLHLSMSSFFSSSLSSFFPWVPNEDGSWSFWISWSKREAPCWPLWYLSPHQSVSWRAGRRRWALPGAVQEPLGRKQRSLSALWEQGVALAFIPWGFGGALHCLEVSKQ